MKMNLIKALSVGAVLALGMSSNAFALAITPASGCIAISSDPVCTAITRWEGNQTGQAQIDTAIAGILGSSTELYKQDVGGSESGGLAGNYTTTFANSTSEPSEATIVHDGGAFVGPTAYLLVKDGNNSPAWYLFNLTALGWNGTETLNLTAFWPGNGAISHVTLYGTRGTAVPEPGTLALLGMGLVGFGIARRRLRS